VGPRIGSTTMSTMPSSSLSLLASATRKPAYTLGCTSSLWKTVTRSRHGSMLECSTAVGHDIAAFVLSLVLHRSNSGAKSDNIARWLLRKVEGDEAGPATIVTWKNEKCTRHLQQAMWVL
jgi:hypothetical protein